MRRVVDGRCSSHNDEAAARTEGIKVAFLELYRDGLNSMEYCIASVGIARTTLFNLREDDPDFDAAVLETRDRANEIRLAAVEDSLFSRIIAGTASAGETIFWLVNRSNGRWRDVKRVEHSGAILHGLLAAVAAMPSNEVLALMELPEEEKRRRLLEMDGGPQLVE